MFIYKLLSNPSQQYTVEHLLCPGHDAGVSYAFYHLILITFLWGRNYYFTHLQIKQLKPSFLATCLSEKWLAQAYTASKWQNQYRYKIYSQIVFLKGCTKFIFLSAMWKIPVFKRCTSSTWGIIMCKFSSWGFEHVTCLFFFFLNMQVFKNVGSKSRSGLHMYLSFGV